MKTVMDVKNALNPDLFVDMVREMQAKRPSRERKEVQAKSKAKRNNIVPLFGVAKYVEKKLCCK